MEILGSWLLNVDGKSGLLFMEIRGVYQFAYSFTQNGKLSGASDESGSTPI